MAKSIDFWILILALLVFNGLILTAVIFTLSKGNVSKALNEKDPGGNATDAASYSRITGFIGAAAVTSFFWALGNILLYKSIEDTNAAADVYGLVNGVSRYFLIGSALFLPYAFNQLKSIFSADPAAADSAKKAQDALSQVQVAQQDVTKNAAAATTAAQAAATSAGNAQQHATTAVDAATKATAAATAGGPVVIQPRNTTAPGDDTPAGGGP